MLSVNIHEAKTHLSKYLTLVQEGEKVLICKNNFPIAELRAYVPQNKPIKLGGLKGKIKIKRDFDKLSDEFMEYFK